MTCRLLLLVDGNDRSRERRVADLASTGEFEAVAVAGARAALACIGREPFDGFLIETELPDMDGVALCGRIRREYPGVPIVMLTDQVDDDGAIRGLDAGAVDVVPRATAPAVLCARLRAHLRPYERSADALLRIGPYRFRPSAKRLHDPGSGQDIALTGTEAGLLRYLCRAGRRTVPRQELMDKVLGYCAEASSHTVETHIYRLRRKLESDPRRPALLLTDGAGYCLIGAA